MSYPRVLQTAAWATIIAIRAMVAAPADESLARRIGASASLQGGLIVHVGCGEGALTTALRLDERFLVHGLDTSPANVARARAHIAGNALNGSVTVSRFDGIRLPFPDNLVNLVVVTTGKCEVPAEELLRALAPGGTAAIKQEGNEDLLARIPHRLPFVVDGLALFTKPVPDDTDEWTHFLHDATGNAVASDTRVGPPRYMQWLARPDWTRNHHTLASISSVVSAGGRIFTIVDEGPPASLSVPGVWSLTARDAFNGKLLWKRPFDSWAWHRHGFRSGPVQLPRTLVTDGDRVYAPLGLGAPAAALDAASGETLRQYQGTEGAEELVLANGALYVVVGAPGPEQAGVGPKKARKTPFPNTKSILAFSADTGAKLWAWPDAGSTQLTPLTLAVSGQRAFIQDGQHVVALDAGKGGELWRSEPFDTPLAKPPQKLQGKGKRRGLGMRSAGWSVATLVVSEDVLMWADGKKARALSVSDGRPLWSCECKPSFKSPVELMVIDGLVWLGPEFGQGRDLHTGEVKKTNNLAQLVWTAGHHHRCYRNKATDRYIMTAKRGIEFLDLVDGEHSRNNWVRGLCQYGIMPCNGLIYAPSHACGCYMEAKLYGFWALAPSRTDRPAPDDQPKAEPRLTRGSAYPLNPPPSTLHPPPSSAWPTYRGNTLRSGSTTTPLPTELKPLWRTEAGSTLSAPVSAQGVVLVAAVDEHRIVALDARTGKSRWAFTAGGRVDSPPTIHEDTAVFGCSDGCVYCLRLTDGQLIWRFRAAPEQRFSVVRDQVESVWPVHGSVLVKDNVAYTAAGRSSYLDGGIWLYGLNPQTGDIVHRTLVRSEHPDVDDGQKLEGTEGEQPRTIAQNTVDAKTLRAPDRSDSFSMDGGVTSDVLVTDGHSIYLRHLRFDAALKLQATKGRHLFSTTRLLDDAEVHRSHWVLGTADFSRIPVAYSWIANRFGGAYKSRLAVPYGLLLAFDDNTVWGAKRHKGYTLYAQANAPFAADEAALPDFRTTPTPQPPEWRWSGQVQVRPRALVRAGNVLVVAGTPVGQAVKDLSNAYAGLEGGVLWIGSAADGNAIGTHELESPPVWDGMAVADERLFISSCDGHVSCWGKAL